MIIDVANLNRLSVLKKHPITLGPQVDNSQLPEDATRGWVYGVWYCGTAYDPVELYGQYPPSFLVRVMAMFPEVPTNEILHCPSGRLGSEHGITVDAAADAVRKPSTQANVTALPFANHTFSLILSDPPYTDDAAKYKKQYGCDAWPMRKAMIEFHRVLKPGGYLGMLHTRYPVFRKANYDIKGLIAVVSGAGRRTRMFSLFERSQTEWQEPKRKLPR